MLARLLPKGRGYAKGGEWRISEAIDLSKPAVVERLKKLESLGFIRKTGKGAHVKYFIPSPP